MSYEMTNLGLHIRLLVSPEVSRTVPNSIVGDGLGNFRWAGLNCMRIRGGPPIGIWLEELALHKHHNATGQYMRTNSQELCPDIDTLPLQLTEIYFIDPDRQVLRGLGAFRQRRQELQIDKICSIHLAGIRRSTYRLHYVDVWALEDSSQLLDTGELVHVRIPNIGRGTLLFKNTADDLFGLVLDLKADGITWALACSFPGSEDDLEEDIEHVHHMIENEPDLQGGFLKYGDKATGSFTADHSLSLRVYHSIVSGELGFAMQIFFFARKEDLKN
ncbi:hypothetical protein BKA64DRAFT_634138 [Cadophora sp. MPI-SDFR-AT-0126]|nr:hypothetical protein BKA64DRAFT_634138 [Leotiomycetes sp. MPI-SDFR-AT-0126]